MEVYFARLVRGLLSWDKCGSVEVEGFFQDASVVTYIHLCCFGNDDECVRANTRLRRTSCLICVDAIIGK